MVVVQDLPGFGLEIANYTFKDNLDWLFKFTDPRVLFLAQPTYILSEYLFYFLGLLTLIHAFIVGGRWKYLWLATVIHGLTTEFASFYMPDIDNYWHSQTSIMLVGRRLPLHIPLIYPTFMYVAAYTTSHMKLSTYIQPLAAGLVEVLMDLPYDIMAIKFVHWTWHDTDPNIFDRHYWVPWNSYYFHMAFGASFNFFLIFWRKRLTGSGDYTNGGGGVVKETLSAILAGLCGMPGGVLQFIILYHPLHDIFKVHSENCYLLLALFYFFIVWRNDRSPPSGSRKNQSEKTHWSAFLLFFGIVLHYSLYLGMAIIGQPQNEVAMGLHERTGPGNVYEDVNTAFGGVLQKRKYLCIKDYDEKYFDFHCLKKPPKDGVEWYTICGTPFDNRVEYISMISGLCIFAFIIYTTLLFKSSSTIRATKADSQRVKKKYH